MHIAGKIKKKGDQRHKTRLLGQVKPLHRVHRSEQCGGPSGSVRTELEAREEYGSVPLRVRLPRKADLQLRVA